MKTVLIANHAERALSNLPERAYLRLVQAIDHFVEDPVSGSHLLRSTDYGTNIFVRRVGDYRIIYSISDDTNTVTVISLGEINGSAV